jgi:hypothetical protein
MTGVPLLARTRSRSNVEDLPVLQVIRLKILTQSKAVGQLRSGFEARIPSIEAT